MFLWVSPHQFTQWIFEIKMNYSVQSNLIRHYSTWPSPMQQSIIITIVIVGPDASSILCYRFDKVSRKQPRYSLLRIFATQQINLHTTSDIFWNISDNIITSCSILNIKECQHLTNMKRYKFKYGAAPKVGVFC